MTEAEIYGIIDTYYAENEQLHTLLLKHSSSVAQKALSIVDNHPEFHCDRDLVFAGAMLHDIGIILTDAPGIFCHGTHPYICHGILGADILRKHDQERLALIAERHTGTGLTPETIVSQGLPLPLDKVLCPVSIEEQIVCYADKFFSKSHPDQCKTIEQTRNMLQRFPDANIELFDKWAAIFE